MAEAALSYRVEGQGPPLVLVHGFVISYNIWKNLLPCLAPHFTLIMVQLPGFGQSPLPPEDQDYTEAAVRGIEGARARLGYEKWNVLGYSSGSRLAEAYVRAHAEHVCRAVFVCPIEVRGIKLRVLKLALAADRMLPAIGSWFLSKWRLKFLIAWFGFNLERDPLCDEWYSEISQGPMRGLKETIRASAKAAEKPFNVPVPFTLIWANRDAVPTLPRRKGPNDIFLHGQHALPVEAAEEVAAAIRSRLGE